MLHPISLSQVAFDRLTVDNADQKVRFDSMMAGVALEAADQKVGLVHRLAVVHRLLREMDVLRS